MTQEPHIKTFYQLRAISGELRQLGDAVTLRTADGRLEGIIVGRTFEKEPRYDVRTRRGLFMHVTETDIVKRIAPPPAPDIYAPAPQPVTTKPVIVGGKDS